METNGINTFYLAAGSSMETLRYLRAEDIQIWMRSVSSPRIHRTFSFDRLRCIRLLCGVHHLTSLALA
jgi:hypothetical protein